jgi:PBP1b-binding outer membrane lipoprotein LpoB
MVTKLKNYMVILSLLLISGCVSTPTPITPTEQERAQLIQCVHKYDDKIVIEYNKENLTRFKLNDIVMFRIIDTRGRAVFLNIYEIENYNCGRI